MDVAYINPFLQATRSVFDKMVHVPVTLGKPYLKDHNEPQNVVHVSISLSGPVHGLVIIGLTQSAAMALASGLAGAPVPGIDADCVDALGEIGNMIVGNAKKDLPNAGDGLVSISAPNIILGAQKVEYPPNQPIIVVPCETPKGRFVLEVGLSRGAANRAA